MAGLAHAVANFEQAKKILPEIFSTIHHQKTIYCACDYVGKRIDLESCDYQPVHDFKRAGRLEWEHVVPAEAFGHSFVEWREGVASCRTRNGKTFKGRKCARTNPQFARMEGDLYNLYPEVGELNGLRNNFSMTELDALGKFSGLTFGGCRAHIFQKKFEPMEEAKGVVARTYFYMEATYPGRGIISDKNQKLFAAWDRLHPVAPWECARYRMISRYQSDPHPIYAERCP